MAKIVVSWGDVARFEVAMSWHEIGWIADKLDDLLLQPPADDQEVVISEGRLELRISDDGDN